MSAGIAPPGDIAVPKDETDTPRSATVTSSPPRPSLTFRHYNTFAVAAVLAASGMVHTEYIFFVIFSIIYLHFISKVAFPPTSTDPPPPVYGRNNKTLGLYVSAAAVIGLFLPVAYICAGVIEGDMAGIKAAAPHLFLLSSQVFMEGLTFAGGYSLPVRVFVPVFYNSVRITSIWEWITSEFSKGLEGFAGSNRLMYVGKCLAVANMALWSFNLFGFLLPFYLPKAFKLYYSKLKD